MQQIKKNQKYHLQNLIALLLFLAFSACNSCHKDVTPIEARVKDQQRPETKKYVVLIHGLNDRGGLDKLQKKLAIDLTGVRVKALNRNNSKTVTIHQQAKEAFEALKKEGIIDKEIVLVGDSQGGIVAWEVYNTYKKELNVKGLITNHSPWEGVPAIASGNAQKLNDLGNKINDTIKRTKDEPFFRLLQQGAGSNIMPSHEQKIAEKLSKVMNSQNEEGVKDINPISQYMSTLKYDVTKADIPILAIGGEVKNFEWCTIDVIAPALSVYLRALSSDEKNFLRNLLKTDSIKNEWGAILGSPQNDLLIPVYSQCAHNISQGKIDKKIIDDYHHFSDITANKKAYELIQATIKKYLNV